MGNFNEQEKSALIHFIQSPGWKVFLRISEELIGKAKEQSNVKGNEFETLKALFGHEGEIKGIQDLIQEVMRQVQL